MGTHTELENINIWIFSGETFCGKTRERIFDVILRSSIWEYFWFNKIFGSIVWIVNSPAVQYWLISFQILKPCSRGTMFIWDNLVWSRFHQSESIYAYLCPRISNQLSDEQGVSIKWFVPIHFASFDGSDIAGNWEKEVKKHILQIIGRAWCDWIVNASKRIYCKTKTRFHLQLIAKLVNANFGKQWRRGGWNALCKLRLR